MSALSQSEESRAPARRRSVEGTQAASGNELFVLFIVLIGKKTVLLFQRVSSVCKRSKMENPPVPTMSAN